MAENRRHTEFFGPDLSRGPFLSGSPPVAAVQLASLIAQLRAPLTRAETDIEAHADFIRALADRLFPDHASQIGLEVGAEVANKITTTIRDDSGSYSLLHCWLADAKGGGETSLAPTSVTFTGATVLQTITAAKRFLIVTPSSGLATAVVDYSGDRTWYWAFARTGRVFYSNAVNFD